MADPVTIDVDPPVDYAGGRIEALSVREPTAGETLAAEKILAGGGGLAAYRGYQLALLASVTGVAAEGLGLLPITIFRRAFGIVDACMSDGLAGSTEEAPELVVAIDPPVTNQGVTIRELQLREPTTAEVQHAEHGLTDRADLVQLRTYALRLVGRVAGIGYATALELPVSKLNAAAAYLQNFIVGGLRTGAT